MKKTIYLIILILLLTGCKSIKNGERHLREKYNTEFTYVNEIESDSGWRKTHYQDKNGIDIIVNCGYDSCVDTYYKAAKEEEIVDYVYSKISKLSFLKDYKFVVYNNDNYCDNKITLDTSIEDALKIDKRCDIGSPIDIFVYYNLNVDENNEILLNFKDNKTILRINKVSYSDYKTYQADSRGYISDYIVKDKISVGTNNKYALIESEEIYST